MRIETSSTLLTSECITLSEVKLHCKIDIDDDDTLLADNIIAARKWIEQYIDGVTIPQTITAYYDECELIKFGRIIKTPVTPALTITSITTYDEEDSGTVFDSAGYYRSGDRIALRDAYDWPSSSVRAFDALKIILVAGFGTFSSPSWTQVVPRDIKKATALLIAHWYQNRGDEEKSNTMPAEIYNLLFPYRRISL